MQSATTYDIYQSQTEATSRVVPSPRYSQPCQPVVTISWWIIHSLLLLCLPLFSVLRKHKILRLFPPLFEPRIRRIFAQRKINIRNFLFTNLAHATILSFFLISRFISLFFSPPHLSRGIKYADVARSRQFLSHGWSSGFFVKLEPRRASKLVHAYVTVNSYKKRGAFYSTMSGETLSFYFENSSSRWNASLARVFDAW